jgi:5'-phosphate synthase pdxT subunit
VPKIGVIALQGDVREHVLLLDDLGCDAVEVRTPEQLAGVDGLIFPGGESTTISMLLESSMLASPLIDMVRAGTPCLGTCAGMILLAAEVLDGRADQLCLGAIDIAVRRNAFGRQVDSFEADLSVNHVGGEPVHAVFIRAPVVERVGDGVEVLASVQGPDGVDRAVACQQNRVVVTSFHPELHGEHRIHQLFLEGI